MKRIALALLAVSAMVSAINPASAFFATNCNDGNEYFCARHFGTPLNGSRKTESVRFDIERDPITNELVTYDRVTREHASQVITRESVIGGSPSDWAGAN